MTAIAGEYRDYHGEVGMVEAVRRAFSNYFNFSGRANRGEYWWFMLAKIIIAILLAIIDVAVIGGAASEATVLSTIWYFATIIPSLALSARRLHDIDRSGWWQLINVIPIIGFIILLVWYSTLGESRPNRFG